MNDDTAGDPMSKLKWSRKDTREISEQMKQQGASISAGTVATMLKANDYSLRVNRKSINESNHPDRDLQFRQIAEVKKRFEDYGVPIVSVDSKKKELIGEFKNDGATWRKNNREVYAHDFRSFASAIAAPYGLFEYLQNRGTVVIGTSYDTAEFAADAIELWLTTTAFTSYPGMRKFCILCDGGGSNGYRTRLWKVQLNKLSLRYGLEITVCHFPPGASKWNPIEHRLFSQISLEWRGQPLTSLEFMKNKIEATKTKTGLNVKAYINEKSYQKGIKIADDEFAKITIRHNDVLPNWNYAIGAN
jgi:hypothetical protein